jgi:hypothetical protein
MPDSPTSGPTQKQGLPVLQLPHSYNPTPDPFAIWKRYYGKPYILAFFVMPAQNFFLGLALGRCIGYCWWLLTLCGAGSAVVGLFNFVVGLGIWRFYGRIFS